MKDIMRKHLWPAALVAALAVVGMLAAFVVLTGPQRGTVEAQSLCATASGSTLQSLIQAGVCSATGGTPAPTTGAGGGGAPGPVAPGQPGATTPATGGGTGSVCDTATGEELRALIQAGVCMEPTTPPPATPIPPTAAPASTPGVPNTFESSSTSANATVKLELTIGNLPEDMLGGSSIELYLEDDFKVPDTIAPGSVYFTVDNPRTDRTGTGGRVYATDPIEIDTDGHFTADKDDYAIQVLIPDMNTADRSEFDGFQGPVEDQTLKVVFTKSAGIKNASEAGEHSVAYSVLGPNDDPNDGPEYPKDPADRTKVKPFIVSTVGKISLSDVDNTRGYELTVTGSGFNNGTSAAVHVLHAVDDNDADGLYPGWWNSLVCAERNLVARSTDTAGAGYCQSWTSLTATQQAKIKADVNLLGGGAAPPANASDAVKAAIARAKATAEATFCRHIIRTGHRVGIAEVGSDDIVAVEFEVTVPIFGPGNTNYLCMVDGEGRTAGTDVEDFELEPSIRVSPKQATVGDTINVFAQDFPSSAGSFTSLEIANQVVYRSGSNGVNTVPVDAGSIGLNGSATVTFDMPGSVNNSPLEGTVRIDAEWGSVSKDDTITLTGSTLRLSVAEVRANESLTIQGEGFGNSSTNGINRADITIDGVPLLVDPDSLENNKVEVSSAGQFVATVYVWGNATDNPALTAGTHTIRVRDTDGFYGTAAIVITEPGMNITPDVLGPRDYLTVTGTDWPVDNQDSTADIGSVEVEVEGRNYTVIPDATGRFTVQHRVSRDVAIPSTQSVKATYKERRQEGERDFFVKTASFDVPAATIEVSPAEGQPGDEVALTVTGMPVYAEVDEITIGGARVGTAQDFRTDREGDVTADGLAIPGLDPGTYSVVMKVGSGDTQTVAIGSITVLLEVVAGAVAQLPGALEALDDNLEAVFYFDNISKEWSFYDPREDFADLNTLSGLVAGQAYWILVGEAVDEVVLNGKTRGLTCSNGDCWNLVVW